MHIPKIIHQIWIGPSTRPDVWMNSVRAFAKEFGFEYKLWDDANIASLPLKNAKEFQAIENYAGKADIARYEILYAEGGVYIDADSVILNPTGLFSIIDNFRSDLGCAIDPSAFFEKNTKIANGVLFSSKHSQLMKKCIDSIPYRNFTEDSFIATGPVFLTEIVVQNSNIPVHIYDSDVFYPGGWHGITDIYAHTKMQHPFKAVMFQYGYSTNGLAKYFDVPQRPILMILSCQKYKENLHAAMQRFSSTTWQVIGVMGGYEQTVLEDSILHLSVPDTYEYLPLKVREAVKYISEAFPTTVGIFKTDEDIFFEQSSLEKAITENASTDYWGVHTDVCGFKKSPFSHKFSDKTLVAYHPPAYYCTGAGYWLSRKSIAALVHSKNKELFSYPGHEDIVVGYSLNREGIQPTRHWITHKEVERVQVFESK